MISVFVVSDFIIRIYIYIILLRICEEGNTVDISVRGFAHSRLHCRPGCRRDQGPPGIYVYFYTHTHTHTLDYMHICHRALMAVTVLHCMDTHTNKHTQTYIYMAPGYTDINGGHTLIHNTYIYLYIHIYATRH